MKNITGCLFAVFLLCASISCRHEEEQIVNCFAESLLVSLKVNPGSENLKSINAELNYSGSMSITSITWDFGDGTKITTTEKVVSHTYLSAGNYEVTATANLDNGKCSFSPKKNLNIQ